MKRGDRVTGQSKTWYDGEPINGWPNPQYLATVLEVIEMAGQTYARLKYDSGRKELELVSRLHKIA